MLDLLLADLLGALGGFETIATPSILSQNHHFQGKNHDFRLKNRHFLLKNHHFCINTHLSSAKISATWVRSPSRQTLQTWSRPPLAMKLPQLEKLKEETCER